MMWCLLFMSLGFFLGTKIFEDLGFIGLWLVFNLLFSWFCSCFLYWLFIIDSFFNRFLSSNFFVYHFLISFFLEIRLFYILLRWLSSRSFFCNFRWFFYSSLWSLYRFLWLIFFGWALSNCFLFLYLFLWRLLFFLFLFSFIFSFNISLLHRLLSFSWLFLLLWMMFFVMLFLLRWKGLLYFFLWGLLFLLRCLLLFLFGSNFPLFWSGLSLYFMGSLLRMLYLLLFLLSRLRSWLSLFLWLRFLFCSLFFLNQWLCLLFFYSLCLFDRSFFGSFFFLSCWFSSSLLFFFITFLHEYINSFINGSWFRLFLLSLCFRSLLTSSLSLFLFSRGTLSWRRFCRELFFFLNFGGNWTRYLFFFLIFRFLSLWRLLFGLASCCWFLCRGLDFFWLFLLWFSRSWGFTFSWLRLNLDFFFLLLFILFFVLLMFCLRWFLLIHKSRRSARSLALLLGCDYIRLLFFWFFKLDFWLLFFFNFFIWFLLYTKWLLFFLFFLFLFVFMLRLCHHHIFFFLLFLNRFRWRRW